LEDRNFYYGASMIGKELYNTCACCR
jgi:hypothetical protein